MNRKFQQQIDTELGEKKWNTALSDAIQQKVLAEQQQSVKKMPVLVPFVSMAMLTIVIFLALSIYPNLQNSEQAAPNEVKFHEVYYSKLHASKYMQAAQPNLWTIGMAKTTNAELLQQLSLAYDEKIKIKEPKIDHAAIISVILYDEMNVAYPYNLYKTFTGELIFEQTQSETFYKYSGTETDMIFEFIENKTSLNSLLIVFGVFIVIILVTELIALKYFGVKRKKEMFDHIKLEKAFRWLPLPYLIYINFKLASRPITLTWWEIIIPFILYQLVVLILMKQQKEPQPYIVVRMLIFCLTLLFIIVNMFML